MKTFIPTMVVLAMAAGVHAQIPIAGPSFTYTQTFTAPEIPEGWAFVESGPNADNTFGISTGSNATGNTYLLGTPSEYCFGGLQSGNVVPTVGVCFTNTMATRHITDVSLQLVAETWRVGADNRPDGLDCQINVGATAIDATGVWTDLDALDYRNPGQQMGSNNVKHSRSLSYTISNLSVAPGSSFCLRWLDLDATGADDAIGIDNFMITSIVSLPVELTGFSGKPDRTSVLLSFSTATETNNSHFAIERSADARTFSTIGQVPGAGTTREERQYTFTDEQPLAGIGYYRLRQVDFNGTESFSRVISVVFSKAGQLTISPSPASDRIRIHLEETLQEDTQWQVFDVTGAQMLSGVWNSEHLDHELDVSSLREGIYTFRLAAGGQVRVRQFRKM